MYKNHPQTNFKSKILIQTSIQNKFQNIESQSILVYPIVKFQVKLKLLEGCISTHNS
jgi:hypothetical protein